MVRTVRHGRRAFTIIELLIVIGIIAILLSLLLSVAGSVRRQARVVQCSANLRNIGQACTAHAAGNDGYLPLAGRVVAAPSTNYNDYPAGLEDPAARRYAYALSPNAAITSTVVPFVAALAPHLGITNLPKRDWGELDVALNAPNGAWRRFMCPDTDSVDKALPDQATMPVDQATMMVCAIGPFTVTAWATNSDYGANEGVFGYHYDHRYRRNRLGGYLAGLRRAEEVVLFADALPRKEPADPIMPLGWVTWTPSLDGKGPATLADALDNTGRATSAQNFDPQRHRNRINIVFADGHVETVPITPEALRHAHLVEK